MPPGKSEDAGSVEELAREAAADAALAEYLERTERGEVVDREAFLAEHPEVADELRTFFDADLDFSTLLDSVLPEDTLKETTPAGIEAPRAKPLIVPSAAGEAGEPARISRVVWLAGGAAVLLIAVLVGVAIKVTPRRETAHPPGHPAAVDTRPKRKFAADVAWDGKAAAPAARPRATKPRVNKLVGHWDFTSVSDLEIPDQSGFGHRATREGTRLERDDVLSRGPQWRDGVLAFDGIDDCVSLGNPPQLDFEGAISMVVWLKLGGTDGLRNVLAHGHTFNPTGGVFVRISNGQYQVGSWDGSDHLAAAAIPPEDVGAWVHVAGVYDGQAWHLYRNGKLAAVKKEPIGSLPVADDWAIGACGNRRERFFRGSIREVRIYDRALSAEEVAGLFEGK